MNSVVKLGLSNLQPLANWMDEYSTPINLSQSQIQRNLLPVLILMTSWFLPLQQIWCEISCTCMTQFPTSLQVSRQGFQPIQTTIFHIVLNGE